MTIEFTRLANVTAIEEVKEEDSVLVVQDGEVKRAPKTAVGGVSEDVPFYKVIVVNTADNTVISVSPGTYEALQNMTNGNHRPTFVNLVLYHEEYGSTAEIFTCFMKDGDSYWNYTYGGSNILKIHPNDVVEYYYDD